MEIILPRLERWQSDVYYSILNDDYDIYNVVSKRQVGKSFLACILLITFSLTRQSTNIIIEPTLHQSRRVFKQICAMLEGGGLIKNANASLLTIEFVNGSEIMFKSAEQRESLRGMTCSGIMIIDEAAFIPNDIFEILYPCCDAHNAKILLVSTPLFTSGEFYEKHIDPNVKSFDWSKYDTSKYLSKEKLEYYRKTISPNKFKSEYLGEFLTEGSYVFGNVKACVGQLSKNLPIYAGIDWASGNDDDDNDYTVITLLDEFGHVCMVDYFRNIEPSSQIDRLSRIINNHPSLKKVQLEKNSIGSVYYDYLKKAVNNKSILMPFDTTNESKRRVVEQLITAFENGDVMIPNDSEMISQLQHYAQEKTKKGYTYNAVSGYHDDCVISLALAYDLISNSNGSYVVTSSYKIRKGKKPPHERYR